MNYLICHSVSLQEDESNGFAVVLVMYFRFAIAAEAHSSRASMSETANGE